jgi:hypothetical protein
LRSQLLEVRNDTANAKSDGANALNLKDLAPLLDTPSHPCSGVQQPLGNPGRFSQMAQCGQDGVNGIDLHLAQICRRVSDTQKRALKHTTQVLCARVVQVNYTIDINTFEKFQTDCLQFNEVGEVQFELHNPIFCDRYAQARTTGSFIVIDSFTNDTVAAGMVEDAIPIPLCTGEAKDDSFVGLRMTQRRGLTVWFTGLSGAGKTTICRSVATELLAQGLPVEIIDGDVIRRNLCRDLGFSRKVGWKISAGSPLSRSSSRPMELSCSWRPSLRIEWPVTKPARRSETSSKFP